MMRRALLGAVLAALLVPASASAGTFCVAAPSCAGMSTTLQGALNFSALSVGPDTIIVGPGEHVLSAGTSTAGHPIEIRGAGVELTRIGFSTSGWDLTVTSGVVTARDLTIDTARAQSTGTLVLDGADASRVAVDGAGARTELRGSTVRGPQGATPVTAVDGTLTMLRSSVEADWPLNGVGQAAVEATRADVEIVSSLVRTLGLSAEGVAVSEGSLQLRQSTIARRVTGRSTGPGVAVLAAAAPSQAVLESTVIDGYAVPLRRAASGSAPAAIEAHYSAWDAANDDVVQGGPGALTAGTGNVSLEPRFISSLDLRLRGDSPLVDAGDPAMPVVGSDVSGHDRVLDGDGDGDPRVDIGALEYQRQAPVLSGIDGPGTVPAGEPATFTSVGAADPDGETLSYAWSFAEDWTSTQSVLTTAFETPGERTIRLTVTDPAGLSTSVHRVVKVGVVPDGADPGSGPAAATPYPVVRKLPRPTPTPNPDVGDRSAPVLSALRVRSKIRRGRARPRHARRGGAIELRLSEAARLTFKVVRRGNRGTRRASFVLRSVPAGTVRVRFTGAIDKRRRLKPGRYRIAVTARDTAGNVSLPATGRFRLVRP